MKKITYIVLTLGLVLSLAACGGDKGNKETTAQTKATETKAETKASETEPQTETKAETKAETNESATETNAQESEVFTAIGEWDGKTYTSQVLGLSLTLPENWTIYSEGGTTQNATQEFLVLDETTNENVIFMSEDLSKAGMDSISELDYIGILKEQLSAQSYTFEEEVYQLDLGGVTFYGLDGTVVSENITVHQAYLCHKIDSKMYIFLITAPDGSDVGISSIMGSFTAAQ